MAFTELLEHSCLYNCFEVWKGTDPKHIAQSPEETEALVTMALLMFEQEVNWGNEALWQKSSNFSPFQRTPNRCWPRDMMMGFIQQSFFYGVDGIKWWKLTRPGTSCFQSSDSLEPCRNFQEYPVDYKLFFINLANTPCADALIVGDYRDRFRRIANQAPNNPRWVH